GTSADQDSRFSNKDKKLLKSLNFPPEFNEKIDMKKIKLDVIKPWMTARITELLGFEDEVVIDFAFGLLEEKNPDPKMMQINLTGFLEKNTQPFILDLWRLLISAQQSKSGIPQKFLDEKKQEIMRNKEHQESLKQRQEAVMDNIRRRKEAEDQDLRKESPHRQESTTRQRRSRFVSNC
ncbi:PWI domain-containing protein, partial [Phascolomyces articulosus]